MSLTLCTNEHPHPGHEHCPGRSRFFTTGDDDGPWVLDSYTGPHHGLIRTGGQVLYENPAWRHPDGSYKTLGMDGVYTVTELVDVGEGLVAAILDDGEWEVSAGNLRQVKNGPENGGQLTGTGT